jgi:anti-sigma regulatory factor (Ser/Thr protein kinase)
MKANRNEADPDDVALVLTEMVTNSVRHGSAPVTVDLVEDVHALMLGVSDGSSDKPTRPTARTAEEGGRGLTILDALTSRWGVWLNPGGGKTVWCEFPTPRPATTPRVRKPPTRRSGDAKVARQ